MSGFNGSTGVPTKQMENAIAQSKASIYTVLDLDTTLVRYNWKTAYRYGDLVFINFQIRFNTKPTFNTYYNIGTLPEEYRPNDDGIREYAGAPLGTNAQASNLCCIKILNDGSISIKALGEPSADCWYTFNVLYLAHDASLESN